MDLTKERIKEDMYKYFKELTWDEERLDEYI